MYSAFNPVLGSQNAPISGALSPLGSAWATNPARILRSLTVGGQTLGWALDFIDQCFPNFCDRKNH